MLIILIFFFSQQGRCNREKPPCKYFHPPQHLKDQLLINGRNHLALKNALMQQMGMAPPTPQPTMIPSPMQPMVSVIFLYNKQTLLLRNLNIEQDEMIFMRRDEIIFVEC